MARIRKLRVVLNTAENVWILDHDAGGLIINQIVKLVGGCLLFRVPVATGNFGIAILAIGFRDFTVMRMQTTRQNRFLAPCCAARHQNGFRARRCPVPHRCVGHIHAGDRCHLGLEFEQILQRTLRDFRLIGGIGRQEFTTLDDVIDRGRNMVAIRPRTQEARHAGRAHVFGGHFRHVAFDLQFAQMMGQIDRLGQQRAFGHVAI